MSTAAVKEIELRAKRNWYEFGKSRVRLSMGPDVGLKDITVKRGITTLPDGQHQVEISFSHFGYRAGPVHFSGYPTLRTYEGQVVLEEVESDPQWQTETEYLNSEQKELSWAEQFLAQLTFPKFK